MRSGDQRVIWHMAKHEEVDEELCQMAANTFEAYKVDVIFVVSVKGFTEAAMRELMKRKDGYRLAAGAEATRLIGLVSRLSYKPQTRSSDLDGLKAHDELVRALAVGEEFHAGSV